MSQIGSFALLLALGLSAYSFLAGFLALFKKDAASARLGETARRAGIATFGAVLLAGIVLRLRYKTDQRLFAYASVIIASVQVFFLLILNFAAHPFAIMQGSLPQDGTGLNPLLQYPEMVIHPPMLYLGYVGFTVPFAFAL